MLELESKSQYEQLTKEGVVIVLFTADWCPDCRFIEPDLPDIEAAFTNYTFIKVDRDKFIDICQDNDIMGIPSFLAYNNGEIIGRFVSKDRKTKDEVMKFIENLPA